MALALLFFMLLTKPPGLYAMDYIALDALVQEAQLNNPELQAASATVKAKQARIRAEGALDDPVVRVEMEELDSTRPLNIAPGNAMAARYTISQMFPFPGKRGLKERMAEKEALMAKASLKAKELEIIAMVKEAYFDYAYNGELTTLIGQIRGLLENMSSIAQARYAIGQVSLQDAIRINVEQAMLASELITLEAEKGVAMARLKSLLGRPQTAELGEPGPLSRERIAKDYKELMDAALRLNPEIKMQEAALDRGALATSLASRNYLPDLMAGAGPVQRDGRVHGFDVMFQINLPIWFDKYGGLSDEAGHGAASARSGLMATKNIKAYEVKAALLQVEAADKMRSLYETSLVPQLELSYESALKNYQTGRIDLLGLLDAQRGLKRGGIELLKALLDYRKRVVVLEKIIGGEASR
ncbi:MAG: TolC family protein [Deltaproteobacteria bacterium]|nr:TolC family protein [Deltaproteobacteria bacterium]